MSITTHYGITIAPIIKTISIARKTRELWAASYLFSYLMKKIIEKLNEKNKEKAEILLPYAKDNIEIAENPNSPINLFTDQYGAGIFPDRCVFQINLEGDNDKSAIEKVNDILETVKSEFIEKIVAHSKSHFTKMDTEKAKDYFNNYFQIYLVSKSLKDNLASRKIVEQMFAALDIVELQQQISPPEQTSYIIDFLSTASFKGKEHSFLIQAAENLDNKDNVRFESVIEIATTDIHDKIGDKSEIFTFDKNEDEVIDKLKKIDEVKKSFRTYHKYIAIVHIDGDNFGEIIKNLDDENYSNFSETITRFSLIINEVIKKYGGLPIYIGGDDAVFFAPLRVDNQTIFDLLDEIDEVFQEQFKGLINGENDKKAIPSLSAGISMTYYKYPLYEALESSRHQLFEVAKKELRASGIAKNATSFNLEKHSGQTFAGTFFKYQKKEKGGEKKEGDEKPNNSYDAFKQMMRINIDQDNFLGSIVQFAVKNEIILREIGKIPNRVIEFIDNNYNESVHQNGDFEKFLDKLKLLIPLVYTEYRGSIDKEKTDNRNTALVSILRMVKFLNRKDND